jgi:hypothetical protein
MNKIKITYDEWTEIGKYNHAAKWLRPLCSYTLIKEPDGRFKREQCVGWFIYLLIFIPVHILQILWCMWDGGLKEFEINERYLGSDWLVVGSESYTKAEKIWNSKNY